MNSGVKLKYQSIERTLSRTFSLTLNYNKRLTEKQKETDITDLHFSDLHRHLINGEQF